VRLSTSQHRRHGAWKPISASISLATRCPTSSLVGLVMLVAQAVGGTRFRSGAFAIGWFFAMA
jgi:hypothetical protein